MPRHQGKHQDAVSKMIDHDILLADENVFKMLGSNVCCLYGLILKCIGVESVKNCISIINPLVC